MQHKDFFSIPEVAKIVGLSRSQVFRKVKSGEIPAQRVGRIFLVSKKYIDAIFALGELTKEDQEEIEKAVRKVVHQYGETIKRLGKE